MIQRPGLIFHCCLSHTSGFEVPGASVEMGRGGSLYIILGEHWYLFWSTSWPSYSQQFALATVT
jgi:hypothetical protein